MFDQNDEKKLDWMYKGANSMVDREEYLLGRNVDKSLEQLNAEEKQKQLGIVPPKNHVEHECIPPSIRDYKLQQALAEQVDLQAKLQEDPLLSIQKKEEETRRNFLQNPVQLKKLQKALSKQQKKSKKGKRELEEKLEYLQDNPLGMDRQNKKSKRDKDLDIILMHKFNAMKSKLSEKDLTDIMQGNFTDTDSDSAVEEEYVESEDEYTKFKNRKRNQGRDAVEKPKKKKPKKKKYESSDDSSDEEEVKKKAVKKKKRKKRESSSEDSDSSDSEDKPKKKKRKSSKNKKRSKSKDAKKKSKKSRKKKESSSEESSSESSSDSSSSSSEEEKKSKHSKKRSEKGKKNTDNQNKKEDKRKQRSLSAEKEKVDRRNRSRSRDELKGRDNSRNQKRFRNNDSPERRKPFRDDKGGYRNNQQIHEDAYKSDRRNRSRSRDRRNYDNDNRGRSNRNERGQWNRSYDRKRDHQDYRKKSYERKYDESVRRERRRSRSDQRKSRSLSKSRNIENPGGNQRSGSMEKLDKYRECRNRSNSVERCTPTKDVKKIVGPERPPDYYPPSNSDEEETPKVKNWGLVKCDGTKIPLGTSSHKSVVAKKEEAVEVQKEVPAKKKKLSEEEKDKLRREMMENAAWRDEEREKKVKAYREKDAKDEVKEFDPDFMHKELVKSSDNNTTVEGRIREKLNTIQRSGGDMNSHFLKR